MPPDFASSILFFNLHDPSHRAYLPVDAITASQLGRHSHSVITGLSIHDSQQMGTIYPSTAELIEEQARCILEDVSITCFKVNHLFSVDTLDAIAEIATDYPDTPLITTIGKHFFHKVDLLGSQTAYTDSIVDAYLDILSPVTDIAVIDLNYFSQWTSEALEIEHPQDLLKFLFSSGVVACLLLNEKNHDNDGFISHRLVFSDGTQHLFAHDHQIACTPAEFADATATVISCLLEKDLPIPDVCNKAINLTLKQFKRLVRIGMSQAQRDFTL